MSEAPHDMPEMPADGPRFAKARHVLAGFVGLALVIWLLSGFYKVGTGEVAVVERLGEYVGESEGKIIVLDAGLHYHLPWPIDRVSVISTKQEFPLQINAFNSSPEEYSEFKRDLIHKGADPVILNALFDPYLVTSDKSVVHIDLNVRFNISDPVAWLKSVSHEYSQKYDPSKKEDMRNALFQQIAQRVVLAQVSRMTLDQVLREGRAELERNIQTEFQKGLEQPDPSDITGARRSGLGITIRAVSLSVAEVPDAVKPAYANLVTQAQRAQAYKVNADADAAAMVAKADGETSTLKADAESYRQGAIQVALGEADRFTQVYEQFKNAPNLSRINLWIDAARLVYGAAKRIYFVQPGQKTTIIVDPPQFDTNQVRPGGG